MTPPLAPPPGGVKALLREDVLILIGLIVQSGLIAWLWAAGMAALKRRRRRAELAEAIAESASYALDLERFRFEYMVGFEGGDIYAWLSGPARLVWLEEHDGEGLSPRDQYDGFRVRLRELRKQLWIARGFPDVSELAEPGRKPSTEERELHAEKVRVLRQITTTQRWKEQDKALKPAKAEAPSEDQ